MTCITISENISIVWWVQCDVRFVFLHSCDEKENWNHFWLCYITRGQWKDLMGKIKTDVNDLVNTGLWEEPEGPEKSRASESFMAGEINRMKRLLSDTGKLQGSDE